MDRRPTQTGWDFSGNGSRCRLFAGKILWPAVAASRCAAASLSLHTKDVSITVDRGRIQSDPSQLLCVGIRLVWSHSERSEPDLPATEPFIRTSDGPGSGIEHSGEV